ncbi:hypothetical protein CesoFtcFv8_011861 [Champsocephalus esox]|uniref:Uncharacterized protein n=1 Tax=Champsocephalus esox TaxID=159716 RepID=A0AAN8GXP8_9TELE|nr:hypothetical protein CesoFtcFv8_011861 [Champsocephalus esox]
MQPQSLTRQPSQQLQTQQRQQARQSLSQPTPPPAQSQTQPHFQRIQTQPRPQLTRPHVQHLSSHRPSPNLTRTNPAPQNQGEQPQDLSTTRPSRGSLLPSREVRDEGVKAEGRRDPASESREVSRGDRGSNSNSRPSSSLPPRPTGPSGAGVGLVTGARLRAEPEADRELRDMVPQSAVPCPSREETVESRTAVSERVS